MIGDKERILTALIYDCCSEIRFPRRDGEQPRISFPFREPEPGELVVAQSSFHFHEWTIGFFIQKLSDGALIREIGSKRICTYRNESFAPVVGMQYEEMLDCERREFYVKLLKAMRKDDTEYLHRFASLRLDENTAVVRVRERWTSRRYEISFPWKPRMTIKSIIAALKEGGYGDDAKFPGERKLCE